MSKVRVSQPHTLSPIEARERLGAFEEMLRKYSVKLVWRGDSANIKGMGVSGSVDVQPKRVDVVVKLGMLARAAGVDPERLKGSIERRLQAAFSDSDS